MALRIRCVGCGYILATKVPEADAIFTCPSCKGRYSIRRGCTHVAEFKVERQPLPFKCKYCGETYATPHAIRSHYTRMHADQYLADKDEQERMRQGFAKLYKENQQWAKNHPAR